MTKKSGLQTNHTMEFSRRAKSYQKHNIIQKKVVKELISSIPSKPKKILDLGCGSGAVYELIDWSFDKFVGIDKADQMCKLHPKDPKITLYHEDFENQKLLQQLGTFDIVISSSALQWAKELDTLFQQISTMTQEVAFAIFCDKTFHTIYQMTDMQTFLPDSKTLSNLLKYYFDVQIDIKTYQLDFPDNISKFRYIKQSGVSGGSKKLSVEQTKRLIKEYPHTFLEFEVLFCYGKVKH